MKNAFGILENFLENQATDFCAGSDLTIADLALIATVSTAEVFIIYFFSSCINLIYIFVLLFFCIILQRLFYLYFFDCLWIHITCRLLALSSMSIKMLPSGRIE